MIILPGCPVRNSVDMYTVMMPSWYRKISRADKFVCTGFGPLLRPAHGHPGPRKAARRENAYRYNDDSPYNIRIVH